MPSKSFRRPVSTRSSGLLMVTEHYCSLIAKWKKNGYEKLCCASCIQTRVRSSYSLLLLIRRWTLD